MLAAFGFFYNTQKEAIDTVASATNKPEDPNARKGLRDAAAGPRRVALWFAAIAFVVWLLLLPELIRQVGDAFEPRLELKEYATANIVFFVAANAWLGVAIYAWSRAKAVKARIDSLA